MSAKFAELCANRIVRATEFAIAFVSRRPCEEHRVWCNTERACGPQVADVESAASLLRGIRTWRRSVFKPNVVILVAMLSVSCSHGDDVRSNAPAFSDYPSRVQYGGTVQSVRLAGNYGPKIRMEVESVIGSRPNFAGHYVVHTWQAGLPLGYLCAIVDARSGEARITTLDSMVGVSTRVDSELIVVDPPEKVRALLDNAMLTQLRGAAWTKYYRWNGVDFIALDSIKVYPNAGNFKRKIDRLPLPKKPSSF